MIWIAFRASYSKHGALAFDKTGKTKRPLSSSSGLSLKADQKTWEGTLWSSPLKQIIGLSLERDPLPLPAGNTKTHTEKNVNPQALSGSLIWGHLIQKEQNCPGLSLTDLWTEKINLQEETKGLTLPSERLCHKQPSILGRVFMERFNLNKRWPLFTVHFLPFPSTACHSFPVPHPRSPKPRLLSVAHNAT